MSAYPAGIDDFRAPVNLPNKSYDPTLTTTIFAEDFTTRGDAIIAIETELGTNPKGSYADVKARLVADESMMELVANKSTTTTLGTSDTLYPSQKAVKTYVDTGLATKQASLGFTAENVANKSTTTTLGTSDTLYPSQKAVKTYVDVAWQAAWPVGAIFISTSSTNPGTSLGFGTWSAFAQGEVLVGKASSGTFGTAGATGGEETHTLSSTEMPSHAHSYASTRGNVNSAAGNSLTWVDATLGNGNTTTTAGSSGAHNNLQPYIVVYMWQRTA